VAQNQVLTEQAAPDIRPGGITVLTMVALGHAVNHAYAALLPLLYPAIMSDLGFGYSRLGLLVAVSRGVGQGLQWLPGYLNQWVRRKTLMGFGTVGQGIFYGISGLATGFGSFMGCLTLNSLCGSPQHPNGNSLILDYFGRAHRARVLAIHYAGGNAGTVLVPLVGALLLTTFGWRTTLLFFGPPGILIGLLMLWFIREEDNGHAMEVREKPRFGRETLAILKNKNVRWVIAAQATAAGGRGLGVVITFVPLYLKQGLGLSVMNTGFLFTLMMIGSVVGPMLAGFLSDRIGARKPILISSYLASTATTLLLIHLGAGTVWILPVILFLLGSFVYSEAPMLQTLAADSTEGLSPDVLFGIYYTFGFGAASLWAIVMGFLVESFGFRPAFYVMASSYAVAALWISRLRLPARGAPR